MQRDERVTLSYNNNILKSKLGEFKTLERRGSLLVTPAPLPARPVARHALSRRRRLTRLQHARSECKYAPLIRQDRPLPAGAPGRAINSRPSEADSQQLITIALRDNPPAPPPPRPARAAPDTFWWAAQRTNSTSHLYT